MGHYFSEGCLVCGSPLVYQQTQTRVCIGCKKSFESTAVCEKGHFICDACHSQTPLEALSALMKTETGSDPVTMAEKILSHPAFALHGPEHHFVLPAVILKSLETRGEEVPPGYWNLILNRCKDLPGGTCGYWGACSAALGAGIALSILTGASPLKSENYDAVHKINARTLGRIAQIGGPRCCKRNLFLSLEETLKFFQEEWGISLSGKNFVCSYFNKNKECIQYHCPFYAVK